MLELAIMATSPELNGQANIPSGFVPELTGHGNDIESRRRIQGDATTYPSLPNWLLGQWVGPPGQEPQWLADKGRKASEPEPGENQSTTL